MAYRESKKGYGNSEMLTDMPIVQKTREQMEEKKGRKPKMARRKEYGGSSKEGLAPEKEIIQERRSSYKSRYKGHLAPEKEIIQEKGADYRNNRYR